MWDALSIEQLRAAEPEAKAKGLELHAFKLENPPYDFAPAFRALAQDDAQMILIGSSPLFSRHSVKIAELAVEHRLPTMFANALPACRRRIKCAHGSSRTSWMRRRFAAASQGD
jgi:hypothetical protein